MWTFLLEKNWESMVNTRLVWSPIQLRLANQWKVLLIDWLTQVLVEIEGIRTYVEFEVINIVDGKNTYHALLGIDLSIYN